MDELTACRVVNDYDLKKVTASRPNSGELCRVTYACDLMRLCVEFWDEILLREENVKPRKIQISEEG